MNNKNTENKVLIIIDLNKEQLEVAKRIITILIDFEVTLAIYTGNKSFSINGVRYKNENALIFPYEYIINLVSPLKDDFIKQFEQKIKDLKKKTLFEKIDKKILFSTKNNIKNFFKNSQIKTPAFSILNQKSADDLFITTPQPSRIFSKDNNFYSGKINNADELKEVLKKIPEEKKGEYLIEEYIDGEDIYSFIFKYKDSFISYSALEEEYISQKNKKIENIINTDNSVSKNKEENKEEESKEQKETKLIYKKLDTKTQEEIKKQSIDFFKYFDFEEFILIHFKKHKTRGLFFLNIFVDYKMFTDKNYKIIEAIFKKENLSLELFIKKKYFKLVF